MKSSFILMITLAFLALSSAKKGHGPPKCDASFLERVCAEDSDAKSTEMMSSMSDECKTKATTAVANFKTKKATACAGKSDVTTACTAMDKAFKEMGDEMGKDCRPKRPPGGPKKGN